MKTIKKLTFSLIVFLVLVSFLPVKAAEKGSITDPSGVSTYTVTNSATEDIYGMTHILAQGKTVTNGATRGQNINVYSMKTDGLTSKLVTWAVQENNYSYKRANIIEAAKDYEEKHPGWIVTGGINADQYFFQFGNKLGADGSAIFEPSPYYPMITDGDIRYTYNPYGNAGNFVGFKNDGSVNGFVLPDGNIGGYRLSVIDEAGETLKEFTVSAVNRNANSGETTVWCAPFHYGFSNQVVDQSINTTNKLFVVEEAELAYVSIDKSYGYPINLPTSLFCKGTISDSSKQSFTVSKGQFAIETTNNEIINELSNGKRVKVELLFNNSELNTIDEGMGYHSIHMQNGVVNESAGTAQYNKQAYSRAMFGKKSDGTYVLITADYVTNLGTHGLTFTECNAVASYYDCVDLYQMDGGGSVTALTRQSDGSFKVTNFPKDSGVPEKPRDNLSYLFFVKRDPGVVQNKPLSNYHSVTLDKKEILGSAKIENLKVQLNNKEYSFGDNTQLVIKGLEEDTTYRAKLTYDVVVDGKTISDYVEINVKTDEYKRPNTVFTVDAVSDTSITFKKTTNNYADRLSNIVLYVGNDTYNMGTEDIYTCSDLYQDVDYKVYCTYDIYDPESGNTYHGQTEEITVSTLAFKVPTIEKIEEGRKSNSSVTVKYEYKDEDKVVEEAYITVNGVKTKEVSTKSGSITVTDLDFENESYQIQLVIEYLDEDGKTVQVKSEILEYKVVTPEPKPEPEKPKGGCGKKGVELFVSLMAASAVIGILLRKKH